MTLPTTGRVPGFTWRPLGRGGRYDRTDRWKALLHSTEGSSIEGAEKAYARYPPHLIVDPIRRRRVQHIDLRTSARALSTAEAEDEPVIQIEIVGYAATLGELDDEHLAWMALEVLAPIRDLCPFELAIPSVGTGSTSAAGYGRGGAHRMSMEEWEQFSGLVGHANVPDDRHWDPGTLDTARILQILTNHYDQGDLDMATANDILNSLTHEVDVTALYWDLLDRGPDPGGLAWLCGIYIATPGDRGVKREHCAAVMRTSAEYQSLH